MRTLIILSTFSLFVASCGKSGSSSNALNQSSCSLNGNWTQCQTDGTNSQWLVLNITDGVVVQDIEDHTGVTDCSGVANSTYNFSLVIEEGQRAQSEFISGGTDLDLTPPTGADFGCGVDVKFFTTMKFFDNCNSFRTSDNSCDSNNRETTLLSDSFVRE